MPSRRATCCRRRWRRTASTSTRRSSPSWPTAAVTRPSASSPTSDCSCRSWSSSSFQIRVTELGWGRRYLMCPPEHFGVLYEINPWMHAEVTVDRDRALQEWDDLVGNLRAAGADVELMEPRDGVPDLVFTANAGVVNGRQFVPSRFRHPERQLETPYDIEWFTSRRWTVDELPPGVAHEGAGDALPFAGVLVSGYRFRSDAAAHAYLSTMTGAAVRSVELADERLYHLDLTFCPLDDRRAIVAPLGWDTYGRRVM